MDKELKEKAESAAKTYFGTDNIDVYCIPEHDAFLDAYQIGYADLTARLKLAVEALEHYANDSNWQPIVKGRITTDIYAGDGCGYDIARQSLAKIGEPAKGRDV